MAMRKTQAGAAVPVTIVQKRTEAGAVVPVEVQGDVMMGADLDAHNDLATAHGLTADISAALTGAASPSAANVLMTDSAVEAALETIFGALIDYSDTDQTVIVPTLGSEILATDPGLEIWSAANNLTNYGESIAGSSTITQESTIIHGGSYSAKFTIDGSNSVASLTALVEVLTAQTWYQFSAWLRSDSGAPVYVMGPSVTATPGQYTSALTTDFVNHIAVRRSVTNLFYVFGRAGGSANLIFYLDDISIKPLTLSSCFICPGRAITADMAVSVQLTHAVTTNRPYQAGVVVSLDDRNNPANFVIAYHDGTQCLMDKCVNGVYTNLIASTVTYIAGATVEIRKSAQQYALYYNGTQRGSTQTVSDVTVYNNKYFGRFSTGGGATLGNLAMSRYPF